MEISIHGVAQEMTTNNVLQIEKNADDFTTQQSMSISVPLYDFWMQL